MPRPRFQRLPPERREEILSASAEVFARDGYEGTSYNALIEQLGFSKGSAYHAFEGKADLYIATLDHEIRRMALALPPTSPAKDRPSFWRGMREWIEQTVRYMGEHPQLAALLQGYALAKQVTPLPELAVDASMAASLGKRIKDGVRLGAVRKDLAPELLAQLSTAMLATLDLHYLARLKALKARELDRALDVYVDTLKRLLAP